MMEILPQVSTNIEIALCKLYNEKLILLALREYASAGAMWAPFLTFRINKMFCFFASFKTLLTFIFKIGGPQPFH